MPLPLHRTVSLNENSKLIMQKIRTRPSLLEFSNVINERNDSKSKNKPNNYTYVVILIIGFNTEDLFPFFISYEIEIKDFDQVDIKYSQHHKYNKEAEMSRN